jgi:hypothetical protein
VDSTIVLAVISAVTVLSSAAVAAVLPYVLTKRRERETDWRKVKLDLYREYIAALSGIVEGRETEEGHIRYVDAVNTITLVASPAVMEALYAFLDYTTSRSVNKSIEQHDENWTNLINAIHRDIYPAIDATLPQTYRLITVPPDMRSSSSLR